MPSRFSTKSEAQLSKMSHAALLTYTRQCHASISGRGASIRRLAGALRMVMNNHPDMVSVEAEDMARLRTDLSAARARLAAAAAPASATAGAVAEAATTTTTTSEATLACSICYEAFNHAERKPVGLGCGHVMCEECCLKSKPQSSNRPLCPYCRAAIERVLPLFL